MADRVQMQIGETRQLRASGGAVAQWTSATPTVATVTDEDLTSGRPGGLVMALGEGQTRITALDFDRVVLFALDIVVEGIPSISVAARDIVRLPQVNGVSRWVTDNDQVAVVIDEGQVRGVSPGIALIRGAEEGTRSVQCVVRVGGTRKVEVGQSVPLARFFSVPVRGWRSSVGDVAVDTNGVVDTGPRPRTVDITAQLGNGQQFTFELRVMQARESPLTTSPRRPSSETQNPADPIVTDPVIREGSEPPLQRGGSLVDEPTTAAVTEQQRRDVEEHLANADRYARDGNRPRVNSELMAARVVANQEAELLQRVDARAEYLRRTHQQVLRQAMTPVLLSLANRRYDEARTHMASLRLPQTGNTLVDSLSQLVTVADRSTSAQESGDNQLEEVENLVCGVWGEALGQCFYSILSPLAQMGLQFGNAVVVCMIDALTGDKRTKMPVDVCRALEGHLAGTGAVAVQCVADRLCSAATPKGQVRWLLEILPGLDLRRHATTFVKCFGNTGPKAREDLVTHLCKMQVNAGNALLDLAAGVLSRLPTDRRLAEAIRKEIGYREFEQLALKWAMTGHGHKGAREVLERMYDYPPSSFSA